MIDGLRGQPLTPGGLGSQIQFRVGLPDARCASLLTIYFTVLPLSFAAIIFTYRH
jgi:hypothetical protein